MIYAINHADSFAKVVMFRQNTFTGYVEQVNQLQFLADASIELENLDTGEKEELSIKSKWESNGYIDEFGLNDSVFMTYYEGKLPLLANHSYQLSVKRANKTYTARAVVPPKAVLDSIETLTEFTDLDSSYAKLRSNYMARSAQNYYQVVANYLKASYLYDSATANIQKFYVPTRKKSALRTCEINKRYRNTFTFNSAKAYPLQSLDTVEVKFSLDTYNKEVVDYLVSAASQPKKSTNPFAEPIYIKYNLQDKDIAGIFGFYHTSDTIKKKVLMFR
ncbi:MAG: hypothetical protein ACKVTZ_18715 [Bacteroidia bacterium]